MEEVEKCCAAHIKRLEERIYKLEELQLSHGESLVDIYGELMVQVVQRTGRSRAEAKEVADSARVIVREVMAEQASQS